jgi:hypothetical protein
VKKFFYVFIFSIFFSAKAQYLITGFGAVGDSITVNTAAIQSAIDSCHNAGGGTVEVPPGNFVTGTVFLKSNVVINLQQGATIQGSTNMNDYPDVIPQMRSYADNYPQKSVFYAENQSNIGITGQGTFNGNGTATIFAEYHSTSPMGFRFISCSNVKYEGVTLRNSAFWMMHNFNIDSLLIKNLYIVNQSWGNNDGIDIDGCRNVLVDSCYADCNDDAVVLKTTSPLANNNNVEVRNCTLATYSRALKIGTETFGITSNVYMHDCNVVFSTHGFLNGGTALDGINFATVNGGGMENILVNNITMTGVSAPIFIRLGNEGITYTDTAAVPSTGYIRNVSINNITATAAKDTTGSITGVPGYYAHSISLSNIDITFPGGWPALDSNFVVPENINVKPDAAMFGDTLPACGLYARHVDSLQLINVCFHAIRPDGRPDFYLDDVANLDTVGDCGSFTAVNIPAGLADNGLQQRLVVYPNPANEFIEVELPVHFETGTIEILDITGKVIEHDVVTLSKPIINLKNLAAGVYFLRINSSQLLTAVRFVKL